MITEFELGQLFVAVPGLQHTHNHELDKSATVSKEFGFDARSFASELLRSLTDVKLKYRMKK